MPNWQVALARLMGRKGDTPISPAPPAWLRSGDFARAAQQLTLNTAQLARLEIASA